MGGNSKIIIENLSLESNQRYLNTNKYHFQFF